MPVFFAKLTLAHNLRLLRKEHGISQSQLAKAAGVSFRAVQEIESGKANPTLQTMGALARSFGVTTSRLLTLSAIRLSDGEAAFLKNYKKVFDSAKVAVGIRTLDGVCLWANCAAQKLYGGIVFNKKPIDLLGIHSKDARGIFRTQLSSERQGNAYPWTNVIQLPKTGEQLFLRYYPTLILPKTGKGAVFASVYISEMDNDCEENYSEYCTHLFEALKR